MEPTIKHSDPKKHSEQKGRLKSSISSLKILIKLFQHHSFFLDVEFNKYTPLYPPNRCRKEDLHTVPERRLLLFVGFGMMMIHDT